MVVKIAVFKTGTYATTYGNSPEDALKWAEALFGEKLTYRPADGMVFQPGNNVPCGLLYREGYRE